MHRGNIVHPAVDTWFGFIIVVCDQFSSLIQQLKSEIYQLRMQKNIDQVKLRKPDAYSCVYFIL